MKDLLGREITEAEARRLLKAKRNPAPLAGYAAPPGTGPAGETCRTCRFYTVQSYTQNRYRKCGLMRDDWTRGPGTDIKARAAACRKWKGKTDDAD